MPPAFVLKALYVLSSVPYRSRVILNLLCNNNCSEKKLFLKTSHFSGCVYLNVPGLNFASHHLRRWDHRARWSKVFLSNGEGRFEISFIFLACANLLRLLRLRNLTRMLKLGWPVGLLLKMSSAQSVTGLLILVNWVVCGTAMEPLSLYRPLVSALYSSCFQSSDSLVFLFVYMQTFVFVSSTCQCLVQFLFTKFWFFINCTRSYSWLLSAFGTNQSLAVTGSAFHSNITPMERFATLSSSSIYAPS